MSQTFYWRKLDDGALLLIAMALFGIVQIYLSYLAAYLYLIISSLVLTLVPLGVVLVQATATALLAELIGTRFFTYQVPRGSSPASPTRLYLRRFAILLLATLIVLGLWAGFYYLIFNYSTFTQIAYLVGYIVSNVGAGLIALIIIYVLDYLFG